MVKTLHEAACPFVENGGACECDSVEIPERETDPMQDAIDAHSMVIEMLEARIQKLEATDAALAARMADFFRLEQRIKALETPLGIKTPILGSKVGG